MALRGDNGFATHNQLGERHNRPRPTSVRERFLGHTRYDACRRIREQPWAKGALVVALTGWGQDEDRRRSQEAGFDNHLVKPVEPAALEELLAGVKSQTA